MGTPGSLWNGSSSEGRRLNWRATLNCSRRLRLLTCAVVLFFFPRLVVCSLISIDMGQTAGVRAFVVRPGAKGQARGGSFIARGRATMPLVFPSLLPEPPILSAVRPAMLRTSAQVRLLTDAGDELLA